MDEKRFDYIQRKIDKIDSCVTEIKIDVAQIKPDLKYHIKRTDILESEMKRKFNFWYILGGISIIVGIIASVSKLVG